jgi:hypothetical protein
MSSVKITRRMVDPITFSESVDLEFLPKGIEDFVLNETTGMVYTLPPQNPKLERQECHLSAPLPPDDSSIPGLQQSSDASEPSSSEDEEVPTNLLVVRPPSPPIPAPGGRNSPYSSPPSPRRPMKVSLKNLQTNTLTKIMEQCSLSRKTSPGTSPRHCKKVSIMESPQEILELSMDDDASIHSDEDLGGFIADNDGKSRGVSWADEIDVKQFSRLGASHFDDMFYASGDLAEFRYEAFMEDAGLDMADYD